MEDRQVPDSQIWYTRKNGDVKGPFPTGMIRRFVLLGRLLPDSEVSPDGALWLRLSDIERLVPEEIKHLDSSDGLERLLLARLREDERRRDRRQEGDGASTERRRGEDRRAPEPELLVARRHARERHVNPSEGQRAARPWTVVSVLLAGLLAAGLYAGWSSPDRQVPVRDCGAAAKAGVDWNNCSLEGVQLPGAVLSRARVDNADLHGATLRGADLSRANLAYSNLGTADLSYANLAHAILLGSGLRSADLTNAVLRDADLSYADLRGAKLGGAQLEGARLGQAIWIDGRVCEPESVGACR